METFLSQIEWMPTVVSFFVAFGLGWLWYSETLFAKGWREGIGIDETDTTPMAPAMLAQAVGTFLMAIVIGVTAAHNDLYMAILVALTFAVLVKANGYFSKKSKYAIMVESGYILAMVSAMIATHAIL